MSLFKFLEPKQDRGHPGLSDVNTLCPLSSHVYSSVKSVGLYFDNGFKFDWHISSAIGLTYS